MRCDNCGHDNDPASKYCDKCGVSFLDAALSHFEQSGRTPARQAAPETPGRRVTNSPARKNAPDKKTAVYIIVPALIVALALIIIISFLSGDGRYADNSFDIFQTPSDTVTVVGGKSGAIVIDGLYSGHFVSLDGSRAALLTSDLTLYYLTGGEKYKVADDVELYTLADGGGGIAYLTDVEEDTGVLRFFSAETRESSKLAENVLTTSFCVSPDGQTVAYASKRGEGDFDAYVVKNGSEPSRLSASVMPFAISDGGQYMYYFKNESESTAFYVKKGDTEARLYDGGYVGGIYNADYSQIIFESDSKVYICVEAGERIKLANGSLTNLVLTPKSQFAHHYNYFVSGADSFKGSSFAADGDVYYIKDDLSTNKMLRVDAESSASRQAAAILCDDMRTMVYKDSLGNLCRIDASDPNAEREQIAKSVEEYVFTSGGRAVYFINSDKELMYAFRSDEPVKISGGASSLAMQPGGSRAFFMEDYTGVSGTVYYSDGSGEKVRLENAGTAHSLSATLSGVYYSVLTDGYHYELFYSPDGNTFSSIYKS